MATNVSPSAAEREVKTSALEEPLAEKLIQREPEAGRLFSLDSFRGFTMFWIIGGSGLMLGLQALRANPVINFIVYELHHTPWQGLRFYDCIWPSFMLMVGVSIPFSFAKRSLTHTHRQIMLHALKRALALFLLGSLRESILLGSPYLIELSSALQPIAIAYFVSVLLARKSVKFQAAVGGLILAGYALLLAFVPAPGIPAGSYEFNHNLVHTVDIALLGQTHWERWLYAPEGWGTVLSAIPTISTTILGLLIGELLMSARSMKTKAGMIAALGVCCLVLGFALSPFVPVVMKLWTTSYGLMSAGVACLQFVFFYWVIDVRRYRKWAFPFAVIGMNALAIYVSESVVPFSHLVGIFTKAVAAGFDRVEPLFHAISVLVVEWLILLWMYKRKIFLRP